MKKKFSIKDANDRLAAAAAAGPISKYRDTTTTEDVPPKVNLQIIIPSGRPQWSIKFCMSLIPMITELYHHPLARPMVANVISRSGSILVQNREFLVNEALANGATHIMFLDDDHSFPTHAPHWLFRHNEPIVFTNYIRRTFPLYPVAFTAEAEDPNARGHFLFTRREDKGLVEVASTGFGCGLVKAEVFERIPEPWFDMTWRKNAHGKWIIDPAEDIYFCRKAREYGYKVYVDQELSNYIKHLGEFEFENIMAMDLSEEQRAYLKEGNSNREPIVEGSK